MKKYAEVKVRTVHVVEVIGDVESAVRHVSKCHKLPTLNTFFFQFWDNVARCVFISLSGPRGTSIYGNHVCTSDWPFVSAVPHGHGLQHELCALHQVPGDATRAPSTLFVRSEVRRQCAGHGAGLQRAVRLHGRFVQSRAWRTSAIQVNDSWTRWRVIEALTRCLLRWILIGTTRTGAPFHTDPRATAGTSDCALLRVLMARYWCSYLAWNAVLTGAKRWALYPPTIHPPGVGPDDADYYTAPAPLRWYLEVYPQIEHKKEPMPIECVQYAGDIIYVPGSTFIWHVSNWHFGRH